jgi:hypothetical protein
MMRSLTDDSLNRALNSLTFGTFDSTYMGLSLENLGQLEAEVNDRIQQLLESGEVEEEQGVVYLRRHPEFRRMQHDPRFRLYWRVRVHEKAHFYQHVSTATSLARMFAAGDSINFMREALQTIPQDGPVSLPLNAWAARLGLSDDHPLVFVIRHFQARLLADLALDGDVYKEQFVEPNKHVLQLFHPDLKPGFWEGTEYTLGFRSLVEGAAKATEWIYCIRDDPSCERAALEDIYGSPDEYVRTFDFLRARVPGKSAHDYLQALVVLSDFALHPFLSAESWPNIWMPINDSSINDLFPGARFVRLVELLAGAGEEHSFSDKAAIFEYLAGRAAEEFNWPRPEACTARLLAFVDEAIAKQPIPVLEFPRDLTHPLIRVRDALRARAKDEMAFIAPINTPLLREHGAFPSGFLGSRYNPPSPSDISVMMYNWYQHVMTLRMTLEKYPSCPLLDNTRFTEAYRTTGECQQLIRGECTVERARALNGWAHLKACGLFKDMMQKVLGPEWERRLFYLYQ